MYKRQTKAIPNYNVMGVCKSALEASVKYLARDLGAKGMRVNAISAGPVSYTHLTLPTTPYV